MVPPPPLFIFVPVPSPLFQWVRLGLEARGPSAEAREARVIGGLALRLEKGSGVKNERRGGGQKFNTVIEP